MEYDSASSCEGRLKDLENSEARGKIVDTNNPAENDTSAQPSTSLRWYNSENTLTAGPRVLPVVAKKTLSSQVMEYYQKYSQNSTLGRYFSLPDSGTNRSCTNYHRPIHESRVDSQRVFESYTIFADDERSRQDLSIPRERRRWARPPLVGQPSSSESAGTNYIRTDSRTPSPICKRPSNDTIPEERNESSRETLAEPRDNEIKAIVSPTSSVASHKPLEWDSGADVGYFNALPPRVRDKDKNMCTIERMALARGCSVAMRLDPEGTNESTASSSFAPKTFMKPDANSTPLIGQISGESESEVEITPIVKNHCTMMKVREDKIAEAYEETEKSCTANNLDESKRNAGASSAGTKYPSEVLCSKEAKNGVQLSPLKKSSSMNVLLLPLSRLSLKRSQSELNLRAGEKKVLPLIFDSTSSIATIVNRPTTCDKFIQTSLNGCSRESIGIQVEVGESDKSDGENVKEIDAGEEEKERERNKEEEKPPLPKRASSLAPKSLHSILKNSGNTYSVRDRNVPVSSTETRKTHGTYDNRKKKDCPKKNDGNMNEEAIPARTSYRNLNGVRQSGRSDSSSEPSRNESSSVRSEILVEQTAEENATGRASNSFEYFPGHVYQNVPNDSTSQASLCDTGGESKGSTMPNTSSSIDEKLWGDSDSLVRDLERSVSILKSLVDANKCDKQVKKRLIHHVIKRLVTAKYTDDRIEHDLDENVPWNPADARNKVYRNDIIQALVTSNKQQNTTDSSAEDWGPKKRNVTRGHSTVSPKKNFAKETRALKEIIDLAVSSRESMINSDKFPFDRHTERTLMDGRKARMGLRSEDQRRDTDDGDKSQSSEYFMPQSLNQHGNDGTNVYYSIDDCNEKSRETPRKIDGEPSTALTITSTATTNTTSTSASQRNLISDRIVLVKERRRAETNDTDWRLPTTMSERKFELGRCSNSESGDTKLINYAEMEKRNQLVWITNEISHLCNLKRLLEEPKKLDGRSRGGSSSPRKRLGQWIAQANSDRNSSRRTDRGRGTGSEAAGENIPRDEPSVNLLENQWSSHGNLASVNSKDMAMEKRNEKQVEAVVHTRKRNSCTQTGSNGESSGHSKTGGEIVTASLPVFASSNVARRDRGFEANTVCNASVQTRSYSPDKVSQVVRASVQANADQTTRKLHSSTCPKSMKSQSNVNGEKCTRSQRHVCYCQRYAAHSRHKACVAHSPRRLVREHSKNCPRRSTIKSEERPIIHQPIVVQIPASSARCTNSKKEAKNQMNATCKSNYAIRELPKRTIERCATCDDDENSSISERIEKSGPPARSSKDEESIVICVCPKNCSCDEEDRERGGNDLEENRENRCETGSSMETKTSRGEDFSPRCTCNIEERSSNDGETNGHTGDRGMRKNVSPAEANSAEKTCKSCRTCGTSWPIKDRKSTNRRCKCSQDYLKPVAYELKFDDEIRDKPRRVDGKKTGKIDKIGSRGLKENTKNRSEIIVSPSVFEESPENCARDDNEEGVIDKDETENKYPGNLKDFLATNRPEFLDNVETRRRYMSELSQLRQLKREKRKQFLAMAGASNFLNPQHPVKAAAVIGQRKISDYEMKLKLRMRYLRLNEVRNKRRQREKEEAARRNHLMGKLFGRKLQQKVLKGQVDLSQSVSVISDL